MTVTKIKAREQFEALLLGRKPLVMNFWAAWCGPSKCISPIFEELSKEHEELEFLLVDVEDKVFGLEFAQANGIRAMPTFQVFENGVKVAEMVGGDDCKLRKMIAEFSKH